MFVMPHPLYPVCTVYRLASIHNTDMGTNIVMHNIGLYFCTLTYHRGVGNTYSCKWTHHEP